eukprot:1821709-Pleurochrysis_carterae.AAC.2
MLAKNHVNRWPEKMAGEEISLPVQIGAAWRTWREAYARFSRLSGCGSALLRSCVIRQLHC